MTTGSRFGTTTWAIRRRLRQPPPKSRPKRRRSNEKLKRGDYGDEQRADVTLNSSGRAFCVRTSVLALGMQETKRAGRFSAPALVSVYRVDLLNGFGSLVSRNAQRPKETAIVCCDFQRATWLHDPRRRRNFRQCLRLRTVHESDDSFKRDLHLEAGGPRLLAARFDLWIVRIRGCDC